MSLVKWGRPLSNRSRHYVQADVAAALESVKAIDAGLYDLLFYTITQGAGSGVVASKGTHSAGYAVDFSFKHPKWNRQRATAAYYALKPHFGVAFRAYGEVGRNVSAHLHIALRNHSNASAIIAANREDGSRVHERIKQIFKN